MGVQGSLSAEALAAPMVEEATCVIDRRGRPPVQVAGVAHGGTVLHGGGRDGATCYNSGGVHPRLVLVMTVGEEGGCGKIRW